MRPIAGCRSVCRGASAGEAAMVARSRHATAEKARSYGVSARRRPAPDAEGALFGRVLVVQIGRRLRACAVGRSCKAERHEQRSESNAVAVAEAHRLGDLAIADERAVLAAEIFEPCLLVDV